MRGASPHGSTFPLYLHDGFNLWKFSDFVHKRQDFVVQDYHSYYVFTPADASTPASAHSENVEKGISQMLTNASGNQRRNLVVDEWSCALTTQSLSSERDPGEARRRFCTGQMGVYATAAAGWSFWGTISFKHALLGLMEDANSLQEGRLRRRSWVVLQGCRGESSPSNLLLLRPDFKDDTLDERHHVPLSGQPSTCRGRGDGKDQICDRTLVAQEPQT